MGLPVVTLSVLLSFLSSSSAALLPRHDSSFPSSHSSALSSRQSLGYSPVSCHTEATSGRALSSKSYFDDRMTVEKCAIACSGFRYLAWNMEERYTTRATSSLIRLTFHIKCYAGNDFGTGSITTSEADCSFACPGNAEQKCGAGNRLNVYTQSVTDVATPPGTFNPQGCYSEPEQAGNGRALSDKRIDSADMTVEKCAEACAGYTYFGLEYYHEVGHAVHVHFLIMLTRTTVLLWQYLEIWQCGARCVSLCFPLRRSVFRDVWWRLGIEPVQAVRFHAVTNKPLIICHRRLLLRSHKWESSHRCSVLR